MAGLANLSQMLAQNPQWNAGLNMMEGPSMLAKDQEMRLQGAQADLLQNKAQNEKAAQGILAGMGGKITPEMAMKIVPIDPDLGMKLYTAALEQQKADALTNPFGASGGKGGGISDGQTGEDWLKNSGLSDGIQQNVRWIAQGKMAPLTGNALRTPYGQALMAAVGKYDPEGFDTINTGKRAKTAKDFSGSGGARQQLNNIETALIHVAGLKDASEKLGSFPTGNTLRNKALDLANDPDLNAYNTIAKTAADEVAKATAGPGGSTVTDRNERLKEFSANQSVESRQAAIDAAVSLLNGRLEPLVTSYNDGLGTTKQGIHLLSPKAQEAYTKITGMKPEIVGAGGDAAKENPTQYSPEDIQAEMKRRGLLK